VDIVASCCDASSGDRGSSATAVGFDQQFGCAGTSVGTNVMIAVSVGVSGAIQVDSLGRTEISDLDGVRQRDNNGRVRDNVRCQG